MLKTVHFYLKWISIKYLASVNISEHRLLVLLLLAKSNIFTTKILTQVNFNAITSFILDSVNICTADNLLWKRAPLQETVSLSLYIELLNNTSYNKDIKAALMTTVDSTDKWWTEGPQCIKEPSARYQSLLHVVRTAVVPHNFNQDWVWSKEKQKICVQKVARYIEGGTGKLQKSVDTKCENTNDLPCCKIYNKMKNLGMRSIYKHSLTLCHTRLLNWLLPRIYSCKQDFTADHKLLQPTVKNFRGE